VIHCTSLWKLKSKTYIILDPNQPSFSSPLIELMKKFIPDIDLILFNNTLYDSENYEEKRDCLDLSIKIGLEINVKQNVLNKEELVTHIYEMFCNNCKASHLLRTTFSPDYLQLINRELHTTSTINRQYIFNFIKKVSKQTVGKRDRSRSEKDKVKLKEKDDQ
jgi:hypothetical protein